MEKEIKVRKRRFAAFWAVVLLVCGLMVPVVVRAVDFEKDLGLVSQGSSVEAGTYIRAGTVIYLDADGVTCGEGSGSSGGWQQIYDSSSANVTVQAGYRLSHWEVKTVSSETTNSSMSGPGYGNVDYPNSVTLSPVFELETYGITYDLQGGESSSNPTSYTVEDTFTLSAPSKTGNTFQGWTWGDQTTPVVDVTVATGTTGELHYKAHWKVNQYTITVDKADGSEKTTITQDYGTAVETPLDPTREDYIFAGWDQDFPDTMPAENLTITAQWTPYVLEAGSYYLEAGVQYKLGNVTRVSGDSSVYTNGSIIYVSTSGTYTFS